MIVRALLAIAVAVAAVALSEAAGIDAPRHAAARAEPPILTSNVPRDGTLHFAAARPRNGIPREVSVYRLAPRDVRPVRVLPRNRRTWSVSAWDDLVVVNIEGSGLAPAGAVDLRTGRTLAQDAHGPVAGPGGRVAYQGYVDRRSVSAAFVRWGARGRFRPIVRRGIWGMSFLPDGRLVVLQRRDRRAWILIVGRRGVQRRFRIPGNPHYTIRVTRGGLIGYEGGTGTLRVYRPSGRRVAAIRIAGWVPSGTRGNRFVLVEKDGDRIATVAPGAAVEVIGHYDRRYHVYDFEWEPR